jgi:hypothetical protein
MAQTRKPKQPEEAAPPARRGRAAPLADDAGTLARSALGRAGFSDPTLVLRWAELAGPETARLTRPLRLNDGVLTLMAEPAAAVFLQHESRVLKERINTYLGRPAVARVRFVHGPLTQPKDRLARPLPARGPVSAADPARKYEGPEGVRDALLRLAQARRPTMNKGQD